MAYCYICSMTVCLSVGQEYEPCNTAKTTEMMFGVCTQGGARNHVYFLDFIYIHKNYVDII